MFNFFIQIKKLLNKPIMIINIKKTISIIFAYSTFINYSIIYKIINADIPKKWQISFQDPATVSMIGIIDIHHTIMFWLVYIFIVVFFLIAIQLNSSHKDDSFFSISSQQIRYSLKECSWLEIFWTTAPSIILFYEILPSVHSIGYGQDRFPALMTIQIIGHQWYWSYEYSTFSNLLKNKNAEVLRSAYSTDATIINFSNSEISKKNIIWFRLLDTNTKVYIPVSIAVRLLITSEDVIHSWTIPSFGIKLDAIPGKLNATVIEVQRSGLFYGQCSELCGAGHGFMPITVESLIYDGYIIIFYTITEVMIDFINDLVNKKIKNIILNKKNMFFKFIFFSFVVCCAYQLIKAQNIIKALFSFFGILISLIFFFFYLESDYVGSIIMIVYFGAIIIFFAFALMTIDSRYFEVSQTQKTNIYGFKFKNFSFFFLTFFYFFMHYYPLKNINKNFNFNTNIINKINNDKFFFFFDNSSVKIIGQSIYTFYLYPLNFLGVILLISLIASFSVLSINFKKFEKTSFIKLL